ncbi:glycerophosphoryl diester phosphodiesterase membrane domain-containing protein [Mycobacterium sp. SM1]|uniref:DUF7847 domain-containing protein n=1 Tax=Mycobacterium sp. SM1 TaxID=2816243 RepID=UPI001BCF7511|nr:glycerophosphoryl diester phosphodiesterase membrane domain-containing protein [Mycobacterium sp. SM1]MBS4727757.1 glycerophosphoryl diester phosphodiesterase membrane domain-containing protein [Mycobacterium sp. SM1]
MGMLPPGYPGYPEPGDQPLNHDAAGYPPPGQLPPGYGGPPGYPPPSYGPPPGYGPSPGYSPPGYSPPGYGPPPGYPPLGYGGPPLPPGAFTPGIIPLRPLSLADIFNGAVGYIRANPRATLGLTTAVVLIMQVIALIAETGPLAVTRRMRTEPSYQPTWGDVGTWMLSTGVTGLATWIISILLNGVLTVVVGRAVFGSSITVGEAWSKVRGRVPALIGLVALEAAGTVSLIALVATIIAAIAATGGGAAAVLVGLPLTLALLATMAYLFTLLLFAPVLIVLERLPLADAIIRSIALVRHSFWRVLGIRLLAAVVVAVVSFAIAAPLSLAGQVLLAGASATGPLLIGTTLNHLGLAIGQIVTAPFSAGVVVLLYTDRRMRAEAFDLVLQTGAARGPFATASTDYLWLSRPA